MNMTSLPPSYTVSYECVALSEAAGQIYLYISVWHSFCLLSS